jgi:hypothetical protein
VGLTEYPCGRVAMGLVRQDTSDGGEFQRTDCMTRVISARGVCGNSKTLCYSLRIIVGHVSPEEFRSRVTSTAASKRQAWLPSHEIATDEFTNGSFFARNTLARLAI